jgi:hypothetical protein
MKWVIRLFVLAESDTGYVHSTIPNCRKFTGDVRNLPYFEKPFQEQFFLDGQIRTQCVWC